MKHPSVKAVGVQILHAFDSTLHRKIARGHCHIDARIDLHGLVQQEAYSLLLHFFQVSQQRGLRYTLVITGKGSPAGTSGLLRKMVPHWMGTAPFLLYVHAFDSAARCHGGSGALYVKLRNVSFKSSKEVSEH
ncbi:MAG: Small MutS-related domain-containing protein [Candidatus Tokpelaia sp. JSC085]|nr:MAG: Small MutS-related domain-containing protein [Candidatus Tokpelaia sp. JSC085]